MIWVNYVPRTSKQFFSPDLSPALPQIQQGYVWGSAVGSPTRPSAEPQPPTHFCCILAKETHLTMAFLCYFFHAQKQNSIPKDCSSASRILEATDDVNGKESCMNFQVSQVSCATAHTPVKIVRAGKRYPETVISPMLKYF